MANLNRIILIGRVTDNPEILNTTEDNPLAKFVLACDRPLRQNGVKETDFINIVAWGKLAERSAEFLSKGRLILVEGRLQERNFLTQDGQKRWVTEVVASKMRMIEAKKASPEALETAEETPFPEAPDDLKSAEFTFEGASLENSEAPF